jgi:hypothetical protein
MVVMQRVVKPRTKRAQRALEAREPKAIEGSKKVLLVRGHKCSEKVSVPKIIAPMWSRTEVFIITLA